MQKIVILYNQIQNNTPDELDVLAQCDLVSEACVKLGFQVERLAFGNDIQADIARVKEAKPYAVFNLVESTWGIGELFYFGPAMLNAFKIPYTGVPIDALFVTTSKVLSKKIMRSNNLPTADFFAIDEISKLNPAKTYIVKPIWEEASVGINADSVFKGDNVEKLNEISKLSVAHYFVEEFIEGREFNVSILASKNGPEVLPPAEMIFSSYFDNKPKLLGYEAKWDETSEEFKQTNRAFGTISKNSSLHKKLTDACLQCWDTFNLRGYARVDFRVDTAENVYILEINGNPCIAADSGFVAAIDYAGYNRVIMIERILEELN